MRLAFDGVIVEILARVPISPARPLWCTPSIGQTFCLAPSLLQAAAATTTIAKTSHGAPRLTSRDLGNGELDSAAHGVDALRSDMYAVSQMPG